MNFSFAIFMAQLLVSMHVFITLNMMPLGTTMALPVTSKPIESTVENLAWQAWIELPPEQKQQVKSRKVTPKSIFTLPLRVECPEGHRQVDSKCIPIVIGSNAVLIDLNALGLVVGNTPTDDLYDYDDIGDEEDFANMQPQYGGSGMRKEDIEKSIEGLTVELKPPTKDEPLKFNIFENKFHIFHEEPLEDYSGLSNEGGSGAENDNLSSSTSQQSLNATTSRIIINDLANEASNISANDFSQPEKMLPSHNAENKNKNVTTLANEEGDYNIEAISLPVEKFETQKPQQLETFQKDSSSVQLVTSLMDSEATTISDEKPQENDIQTLLQTESFLPLLQQATATTLQTSEPTNDSFALSSSTMPVEQTEISPEILNFNVDEDVTTMTSIRDLEVAQVKNKQEFTRSVTMNPLIEDDIVSDDDNDRVNDTTTLETEMTDEPVETTTPIQLDETTIIETSSSLSTMPTTLPQQQQLQDLKELFSQQEQTLTNFEEFQRMRIGQKHQHVVLKKSKVKPVEVLATAATITTKRLATAAEAATDTVTPLLTVHNENDNKNDRFFYQHTAKQDTKEETQHPITVSTMATTDTAKATDIKKMALTSEIDLNEELPLINELVKGIKPANKTLTTMQQQTTTTTTEKQETKINLDVSTTLSSASSSESSAVDFNAATPLRQQIWSKIMPLLTSATTPKTINTNNENEKNSSKSLTENTAADISNDIQATQATGTTSLSSTSHYDGNSKIIRINAVNTPNSADTTEATTTTLSSSSIETSTENQVYEPYWWLPISWRFDKPTTEPKISENPTKDEQVKNEEQQPLLLRFWSAYHAPKSS